MKRFEGCVIWVWKLIALLGGLHMPRLATFARERNFLVLKLKISQRMQQQTSRRRSVRIPRPRVQDSMIFVLQDFILPRANIHYPQYS